MSKKIKGPSDKETAKVSFKIGEREVMVERLYDPSDQMEVFAKSALGQKLFVLSLQLRTMGSRDDDIERLSRKLVSMPGFSTIALSGFLDAASMHTGSFREPLKVIEAVAEHSCRFQPDPKSAMMAAISLFQDFAALGSKEEESRLLSSLKGN